MNQYRYPGAQPFRTEQQHIFYGRNDDVLRLYRLIKLEPLVVLYSKSGMGKSSMLNAGIIPHVWEEEEYTPISIRFKAYNKDQASMPDQITRLSVAPQGSVSSFLDTLIENETSLWHDLKEAQLQGKKKLLLIFDQFEELFTYPPEAIQAFKKDFAEALYAKIPERYRKVVEKQLENDTSQLSSEHLSQLHEPFELRTVMAIRSDRMSLLNNLTDYLPTILKNCVELTPLSIKAAQQAIIKPAQSQEAIFTTPSFLYEDSTIQYILNFLTQNSTENIESTQLQIICQSVEKKVTQTGQTITIDDLGDLNSVIENYYYDQLSLLGNEEEQLPARKLIEEGLVFEEEERRLSVYEGQIFKNYGISPDTLKQLVDAHLLRSEPAISGGYTYELSHDTLVPAVLKAKNKRLQEERLIAEENLKQQREAELEAIKQQAKIERQKRQRANILTIIALIGLFLALGAMSWAFKQQEIAEKALTDFKIEETKRQLAEINKEKSEFEEILRRSDEIKKAGGDLPALYIEEIKKMKEKYPNDSLLKSKIYRIENY
jgi:hypothetical protein